MVTERLRTESEGQRSSWLVGSRYRLIREVTLTVNHDRPYRPDGPKLRKGTAVLLLELKQDSRFSARKNQSIPMGPLMGLVASTGKGGPWVFGWCALEGLDDHAGQGPVAQGVPERGSWEVGGRYSIAGYSARRSWLSAACCGGVRAAEAPQRARRASVTGASAQQPAAVLRRGRELSSPGVCELGVAEEVLALEFAASFCEEGGEEDPRLRARVRTDSGEVGWITVEMPGEVILNPLNLYSVEAFKAGVLLSRGPVERRCVHDAVGEGVTEGHGQAWQNGKYRVLLDAPLLDDRSSRRGYAWRGSLVVVEEVQTHQEGGHKRMRLRVRAEGSEPARGEGGCWITWLGGRRPPLDIRDHLEHQKFLTPSRPPPHQEESGEGVQSPAASPCRERRVALGGCEERSPVEALAEEEPAEQVMVEEAQAVEALPEGPLSEGEYIVNVARQPDSKLGIHVQVPEAGGPQAEELVIDEVGFEGLIPDWNAENPESVITAGDRILCVNAARGESMAAMVKELRDSPHLSIHLRHATVYETERSSFHASSPSSAETAASVRAGLTEDDESPRSLPQLEPISTDLDFSESDAASSALFTARTLLTSRAGSKELAKVLQTQQRQDVGDWGDMGSRRQRHVWCPPETTGQRRELAKTAGWILTDSPRSVVPKLAVSPVATSENAYELPDEDAGSACSSLACSPTAGARPGGAAGAMLQAEMLPPLPRGRRRPAAGQTPLPHLPLRLEEAAARAGYAWEPEAGKEDAFPEPLVGPAVAPSQAAARPSRTCALDQNRNACAPSHPIWLGLAAKLTCTDSRADKMKGSGLFL